jgi:ABC-2 type transport system ATP-binding protein
MKQLAASRRIRCATTLSLDRLQGMPGVASVRRDGATTELLTNDAERVTRDLLTSDASLSGLEVTGAGLEEAFLALTSGRGQGPATVSGGVR